MYLDFIYLRLFVGIVLQALTFVKKIIDMYRNGKVVKVIEITKSRLLELKEKNSFLTINISDKIINEHKDNDIIGIINGDIQCFNDKCDKIPDCGFVYKPENHGYKKLDEDFRCDFGDAIRLLKQGFKIARAGWNGKNMWLVYVPGSYCKKCYDGTPYKDAGLDNVQIDAHIDMLTSQGTIQPGWLASQSDMLSEDWTIIE